LAAVSDLLRDGVPSVVGAREHPLVGGGVAMPEVFRMLTEESATRSEAADQ